MPTDALTLTDVHAYYGDSHVLMDVSFVLPKGELLGLLGRNGAGKSSTLSTIVGLLTPRRGRIDVFGRPIGGLPPEAIASRGIALVPQGRRIFRSLTVRENLLVAARRPASGQAARWTLDTVFRMFPRLERRQRQLAGQMSGGEQQMLAIGRALIGNPEVLLMDEPSEGLAPQIVSEVMQIVRDLKQQGLSIVLVEQNPQLVMDVADRIVFLNTGRVTDLGPVSEFQDRPDRIRRHLGVV